MGGSRALALGWALVAGQLGSSGLAIVVPLSISGVPGAATVGVAYSFIPAVSGGSGTKFFSLSGTLPGGLSFSSSTGAITGTPTTAGTTSGLSITVSDASGSAPLSGLSVVVSAAFFRPSADRQVQNFFATNSQTSGISAYTSATSATFRIRRVIPQGKRVTGQPYKATFTYENWANLSNLTEGNGSTDPITVSLGIEYNTNTALKSWAPGAAGATVVDQSVGGPISVPAGGLGVINATAAMPDGGFVYYELVCVTGATGWPLGINMTPAAFNADAYVAGMDLHAAAPSSANWVTTGGIPGYAASKIVSQVSSDQKDIVVIGNSIALGSGNNPNDISYFNLAAGEGLGTAAITGGPTLGLSKIARTGDANYGLAANYAKRIALLGNPIQAHRLIYALDATNDFANGRTLAQAQADYLTNLGRLQGRGVPITLTTLLPRTTGGNVTEFNAGFKANRNAFIAWQYTLIGQYGVDSIFDAAAAVENAPASQAGNGDNTWKDIRFTSDYTHPSGGAVGSGTSGTLGTSAAGGGHATLAAAFLTFLNTLS